MPKTREQYNAYMREYMLRRYHDRRGKAIEALGGACVKCGSTEGLEFDHRDRSEKGFTIAKLWSLREETFQSELAKCQLLCKECHLEKSKLERFGKSEPRHGTAHMYQKYRCRCELCVQAIREYHRMRRNKKYPGDITAIPV